jgi:parallel beta-helix repeat protein
MGNEISKNSIECNSACGLRLSSSNYNNVSQNVFIGNSDGVVFDNSSDNNFEENTIVSSYNCGIKVMNFSDNNTISSNNVTRSTTEGIRLFSSRHNTIHKNSIRENGGDGIDLLLDSNCNNISQNSIERNNYGILLYAYSNNNSLSYNILSGNTIGVKLEISSNNSICNNKVNTSSNDGIYLRYCSDNTIDENSVEAAGCFGIQIYCSPDNLLRNNMMVNNCFGFGVDGWEMSDFANDVDTSNTVNGKPVFYLTNKQGVFVPTTVGCVILINCSNITIQNVNLTDNEYGVLLFETTNVLISETSISFNQNGIYAVNSSDCMIYHNNFLNNMRQIYTSGSVNIWDGGYPSGGNYWSDYSGTDANNDGVGEVPYVIDTSNRDNNPLIGIISIFSVGTWNNETRFVNLVSNSTISDFRLNTDQTPERISFTVEGPNATTGFCRVCVPDSLLEGPYAVLVNGTPVSQNTVTNGTHTFIHFTYNHSRNLITVIGKSVLPEFPHTMILFIFMMIALIASAMYSKALRRRHDRKTC